MGKRDSELYKERDAALYEAYLLARRELYAKFGDDQSKLTSIHRMALEQAMKTPQNRFWISQDRTYRILRRLLHAGAPPKTWRTRKKMQTELLEAYNRIKDRRMFNDMPLKFIASFVTFEPSSGFFMSYRRTLRAVYLQRQARKALQKHLNKD